MAQVVKGRIVDFGEDFTVTLVDFGEEISIVPVDFGEDVRVRIVPFGGQKNARLVDSAFHAVSPSEPALGTRGAGGGCAIAVVAASALLGAAIAATWSRSPTAPRSARRPPTP